MTLERTALLVVALIVVLAVTFPYFSNRVSVSGDLPRYRDVSRVLSHATWSSYVDTRSASGVCVVDVNGDGWDDIFIPGLGDFNTDRSMLGNYRLGNALFLNRGVESDGIPRFEDVTDRAGVRNIGKLGVGCVAADYDNDGLLDLVVTNATRGANASFYGFPSFEERDRRIFPPPFFHTDKTDGKYDFPREGGVTLFRNTGVTPDGTPHFKDVTLAARLTRGGNGTSAAFADVNNDGFVDLFVANYLDPDFMSYRAPYMGGHYNVLYRNSGDGTFTDVTKTAGVGGEAEYVYTADGRKLYGWSPDLRDAKGKPAGDPAGNTWAATFTDYNGDGLPDLLTADDLPGRIRLYKNKGNFRFEEVSEANALGVAGAWMGVVAGDVNGDGREDVFATNFGGEVGSRYRPTADEATLFDILNAPNRGTFYDGLWLAGSEGFTNVAKNVEVDWGKWPPDIRWYPPTAPLAGTTVAPEPRGLERGGFGFGAAMFDFDNDGAKDIMWVGDLGRSGIPRHRQYGNAGRLLRNLGDGMRFADVAKTVGALNAADLNDPLTYQNGRGIATGDFNNDGYPDIVIVNGGGFESTDPAAKPLPDVGFDERYLFVYREYRPGPTFLYLSSGGKNNWIKVRLAGRKSNRSAIGTQIRVEYNEKGSAKRQFETIHAGGGYASESSLTSIFGVGSARSVSAVTIRWPSGEVQTIKNPKVNTVLTVTEE